MRIALISTLHRTHDGTPLAFLQMGGRSVLRWQADMALALGCTRIICLGSQSVDEISEVQTHIENSGAEFHLIDKLLQLVRLVSADQEVVIIADGAVVDRTKIPDHLTGGRGVLAIPAEPGLAAGFERIDADYAWAGLLVARGSIVERVADMPDDSDIIALLLRLALQARTPLISLESEVLSNGSLLLALDESVVAERESSLLSQSAAQVSWFGPGNAIAARAAQAMAPHGLQAGPLVAGGFGATLLAAAVVSAFFGFQTLGLGLFAAGCFGLAVRQSFNKLKERLYSQVSSKNLSKYISVIIDVVLVISLAFPLTLQSAHENLFLPVLMIGILRLTAGLASDRLRPMLNDRIALAALLCVAARLGFLTEAVGGLTLIGLISALIFQSKLR